MSKVKAPSIKNVSGYLKLLKGDISPEFQDEEGNVGIDVRLHVWPNGEWTIHTGDSSYDQDHRGYWGSGFLSPRSNCRDLAADLIDQVEEDIAMSASAAE